MKKDIKKTAIRIRNGLQTNNDGFKFSFKVILR